ncbi:HNH endonuclease [Enterococcus sp. AZ126]|uniref:HNH endonuclease n=1 Tax=Enterococcus sp. AZ126 TaxID=2774635 RepID=UPI003F234CFE
MNYRVVPYNQDIIEIISDSISNYESDLKKERLKYYSPQVCKSELNFKEFMENGQVEKFEEIFTYKIIYSMDKFNPIYNSNIKDLQDFLYFKNFNENIVYKLNNSKELMKQDMIELYNSKFSKIGQPGRTHYDRIRNLIDYCPYCQENDVKHLDHFLPKTQFPSLSVSPINLVPLCSDCNTAKKATTGFFNPYFEDVDSEQYLFCDISFQNDDYIIKFKSEQPSSWSKQKYSRVESIFTKMTKGHEILVLFNKWARTTINESKRRLVRSALRGQKDFRETLLDDYKDSVEEQGINYWKSTLYQCLLNNLEDTHKYFSSIVIQD